MSARKATGPKQTGSEKRLAAAGELGLAMVRAYRTGDMAEVLAVRARTPENAGNTLATFLSSVVAGLTADVDDDRLEAVIGAAYLRGMRRPGP